MKRIILSIVALLMGVIGFAQTGFNYKALITDTGNALANQSVTLRFTVLENGTTAVYQETQTATTDANGIVSANIGEGTVVSGDFNTVNWASRQSLKVEIDSGSGYQDFGTNPLKWVPTAKYASKAGSIDFSNITNVPAGLSDGDDDTHLTDAQIAAMGYIKDSNDADHDATNELQNLTLTGTQLSISNGNNVNFTGWDTNAADDFSGDYVDLANKPDVFQIQGSSDPATSFSDDIKHGGDVFIGGQYSSLGSGKSSLLINRRVNNESSHGLVAVVGGSGTQDHYGGYFQLLDAGSGKQYGIRNEIINLGNGSHYGIYSYLNGSGTGAHYGTYHKLSGTGAGSQFGTRNEVTNTGDGYHYGSYSDLNGSGTGTHYGTFNNLHGTGTGLQFGIKNWINVSGNAKHYGSYSYLDGSGTGTHYGTFNQLTGTGIGAQYGVDNYISNSGDAVHYGSYSHLIGGGSGDHYGTYNSLSGTGTGIQYGVNNRIDNSGDAAHYGSYSHLFGSGSGSHFGTYNELSGAGTGQQFGAINIISNSGDADHVGSYSILDGIGSGNKFGTIAYIDPSAGGTHYAIYGIATKAGSYAGYFDGDVYASQKLGIGTDTPETDLHIKGNSNKEIKVEATNSGGVSALTLKTDASIYDYLQFEKYHTSAGGSTAGGLNLGGLSIIRTGATANDLLIDVVNNKNMYFATDNVVNMTITNTGNVEIKNKITAPASGNADMKAYIYGKIYFSSGHVYIDSSKSSSGFSVGRVTAGKYRVALAESGITNYVVTANVVATAVPRIVTYVVNSNSFDIYIWKLDGTLMDADVSFVVYKK